MLVYDGIFEWNGWAVSSSSPKDAAGCGFSISTVPEKRRAASAADDGGGFRPTPDRHDDGRSVRAQRDRAYRHRGQPKMSHRSPTHAVRRIHPPETYGKDNEYVIKAGYDAMELMWQKGRVLFSRIGSLDASLRKSSFPWWKRPPARRETESVC